MLQDLDVGMGVDDAGEVLDERGAGAVAAGMQDPRSGVRSLEPEPELAAGAAVEHRAGGEQLADPVGSLLGEHPDGLGIRQAVAGCERVGRVGPRAVTRTERHRDAPLRPRARAVGQRSLGDAASTGAPRPTAAMRSRARRCRSRG